MTSFSDNYHYLPDEEDAFQKLVDVGCRDECSDSDKRDRASPLSYTFLQDEIASQDTFSMVSLSAYMCVYRVWYYHCVFDLATNRGMKLLMMMTKSRMTLSLRKAISFRR